MSVNRNITRLERPISSGYLVRVMRRGKRHSQFFADADHGGKRKALLAARACRDEMESKLRGYSAKQLARRERSNNTSGVPGVRKVSEVDPRWESEPVYHYWVAQWSPSPGVRKTKRFSIEKYGEDKAYQLAVKARRQGVAQMES